MEDDEIEKVYDTSLWAINQRIILQVIRISVNKQVGKRWEIFDVPRSGVMFKHFITR